MPTASERLVWAQGSPSTLKAVVTTIKGVRIVMGCAICWENFMPLLRYSLYSQGVNLWWGPTADARDSWDPLMRTIAGEGRCFVLSTNQCMKRKDLPTWITGDPKEWLADHSNATEARSWSGSATKSDEGMTNGTFAHPPATSSSGRRLSITRTEENHSIAWRCKDSATTAPPIAEEDKEDKSGKLFGTSHLPPAHDVDPEEYVSRGGAGIVHPTGTTVVGPVWEKQDELLWTEADFEDCERGHLDFDVTGHYSRPDAFRLEVEGLELVPPP